MDPKPLKISDLPLAQVDPHDPVPLYHQIYLDLKSLIQSGRIPPGAAFPVELDLCRAYGVGRQTVRQAIARLVDENLVERYAGRGTFVKSQADRMKFYLDRSFSRQMRELGRMPRSRVIEVAAGALDQSAPAALQAWRGLACLNLVRLRYGDDEPISVQSTTILTEMCPGLDRHDFSRESLYEVLANEYRLAICRIDHTVRAVAADEFRAEMLQVPDGSPLLFVGTTAYLENGSPIEATASYYRGDKYEYSTSQTYCEE